MLGSDTCVLSFSVPAQGLLTALHSSLCLHPAALQQLVLILARLHRTGFCKLPKLCQGLALACQCDLLKHCAPGHLSKVQLAEQGNGRLVAQPHFDLEALHALPPTV